MSGGGGSDKTRTISEPWSGQIPYLTGQAANPHFAPTPGDAWLNALQSVGQGFVRPMPGMTATSIPSLDPYGQMLGQAAPQMPGFGAGAMPGTLPVAGTPGGMPVGTVPGGAPAPVPTPAPGYAGDVDTNRMLASTQERAILASNVAAGMWQAFNRASDRYSSARMGLYDPENPTGASDFARAKDDLERARAQLVDSGFVDPGKPISPDRTKETTSYWMEQPEITGSAGVFAPEVQYVNGQPVFGSPVAAERVPIGQAQPGMGGQGAGQLPYQAQGRQAGPITLTTGETVQPTKAAARGVPTGMVQPSGNMMQPMVQGGVQAPQYGQSVADMYGGTQPFVTSNVTPGVLASAAQYMQGGGPQYMPGPGVVGRTPGEYFSDVAQTLAAAQQLQQAEALQPQIERTYGGIQRSMEQALNQPIDTEALKNPYTDLAMRDYAQEALGTLRDVRLPEIAREGLRRGTFGSMRQALQEGKAIGETQGAISKAGTQLALSEYDKYLAALQNAKELQARRQAQVWAGAPELLSQYGAAKALPSEALSQLGGVAGGIGQQYAGWGQRMLDEEAARYGHYQELPYEMLNRYAGLVGGPLAGTGPSQTVIGPSQRPNRAAGMLGGAASGAAMGSSIMPGWGTAIGAIGGAILGSRG